MRCAMRLGLWNAGWAPRPTHSSHHLTPPHALTKRTLPMDRELDALVGVDRGGETRIHLPFHIQRQLNEVQREHLHQREMEHVCGLMSGLL
jgi:hypothetical protein